MALVSLLPRLDDVEVLQLLGWLLLMLTLGAPSHPDLGGTAAEDLGVLGLQALLLYPSLDHHPNLLSLLHLHCVVE